MQHRLYRLRGQAYVAVYKQLFLSLKKKIATDFQETVLKTGKFTPKDLGYLCVKYQIPVKVMDEWLPEITKYPTGTWERLKEKGFKAKDIGVDWRQE